MSERTYVTDTVVDHVELYYPHDERRHWIVQPGVME